MAARPRFHKPRATLSLLAVCSLALGLTVLRAVAGAQDHARSAAQPRPASSQPVREAW
ncbi:hypothetical protein [Deinococcus sonorensis]|uniref:Uncharacterized protein n=2 Tax=Deinococcus sonorensis TaxID=309891 RepID=A0AAU7UCB7_9DEIO